MILIDAGTAYTKVLNEGRTEVLRSDKVPQHLRADLATGHNAARLSDRTVNELVALARGGMEMIDAQDFNLVDIGCRDIKFVKIRSRRYAGCGWNDSCGSLTGFVLDLLGRYFEVNWNEIEAVCTPLNFTCGVFGISDMFDQIYGGSSVETSIAGLVKGLADRVYSFSERPDELFLSGGLCANPLFLSSFPCPIQPLGRSVLLRGLERTLLREEKK